MQTAQQMRADAHALARKSYQPFRRVPVLARRIGSHGYLAKFAAGSNGLSGVGRLLVYTSCRRIRQI